MMTNGDASTSYTGADPHAVHGLVTQERIQFFRDYFILQNFSKYFLYSYQDGGYVAVGFGLYSENSQKYEGFVNRVDLCDDLSQYESNLGHYLNKPTAGCADGFSWSYISKTQSLHDKLAWGAESPDGKFIFAVGVREFSRYDCI